MTVQAVVGAIGMLNTGASGVLSTMDTRRRQPPKLRQHRASCERGLRLLNDCCMLWSMHKLEPVAVEILMPLVEMLEEAFELQEEATDAMQENEEGNFTWNSVKWSLGQYTAQLEKSKDQLNDEVKVLLLSDPIARGIDAMHRPAQHSRQVVTLHPFNGQHVILVQALDQSALSTQQCSQGVYGAQIRL